MHIASPGVPLDASGLLCLFDECTSVTQQQVSKTIWAQLDVPCKLLYDAYTYNDDFKWRVAGCGGSPFGLRICF